MATRATTGGRFMRSRDGGGEARVTAIELFFDLVFVFAITQISHSLVAHLSWTGAARALFVLLVVWWAWTYTTWMATLIDPGSLHVRVVLLAAMLASLLMAIAIPEAWDDRAWLFAGAYVALQTGRNAFVAWAGPAGSRLRANFTAILVWSLGTGALLLAGAALDGAARAGLWVLALALDYAGPAARYRLPGMPRLTTLDWRVDPGHFAERFQLFVIIALGESIVVTGATAAGDEISAARVLAIEVAFVGSAALWWLYFDTTAGDAGRRLAASDDPGRLARDAYTYAHIPIVAGIILTAVGDELVIAHPGDTLGAAELTGLAAGPALYLAGHVLCRWRMSGAVAWRRIAAVGAVAVLGLAGAVLPALATAAFVTAVLLAVIVVDRLAAT